MVIKDVMKYIESEIVVINATPCEVCGGDYIAEQMEPVIIDDMPYDICSCMCEKCGHFKTFEFSAPFLDNESFDKIKNSMN